MGFLSKFENKMEDGIEGAAGALSRAGISPVQISKKAEKQMRREKIVGAGKQYAPTLYTVLISSKDNAKLFKYYPTLAGEIETYLTARARELGLVMDGAPLVRFLEDPDLKKGKIDVVAELVASSIVEQLRDDEMVRYGLQPNGVRRENAYSATVAAERRHNMEANLQPLENFPPEEQPDLEYDYQSQRLVPADDQDDGQGNALDADAYNAAIEAGFDMSQMPEDYDQVHGMTGYGVGDAYADANAAFDALYDTPHHRQPVQQAEPVQRQAEPVQQAAHPAVQQVIPPAEQHPVVQQAEQQQPQAGAYRESDVFVVPALSEDLEERRAAEASSPLARAAQNAFDPHSQNQAAARAQRQPIDGAAGMAAAGADGMAAVGAVAGAAAVGAAAGAYSTEQEAGSSYAGSQQRQHAASAKRVYLYDQARDRAYQLTGAPQRIGRESASDIVVPDINISRSHAEILMEPDGSWVITDLNSTNGIFVNGRRVQAARLRDADMITLGTSTLEFQDLG